MYTKPRKVKQESRLRRSLSLTNSNNNGTNRINQNGTGVNGSEIHEEELPAPSLTSPYYTLSSRKSTHHQLNGIAEQPDFGFVPSLIPDPFTSLSSKRIPIEAQNGNSRFSYTQSSNGAIIIPDVIDVSQQPDGSSLHYQIYGSSSVPPPYRNPPQTLIPVSGSSNGHTTIVVDSGPISPQSVPDSPVDSFHTHSAKFPLTLDSETAKELQNQLAQQQHKLGVSQDISTIRRSGSAFELEKLIEAFNQEQHALVMSSLHQGLVPKKRLDGIDNPALDIGGPYNNSSSLNGHHHLHNGGNTPASLNPTYQPNSSSSTAPGPGGKMAGYSFSDSSAASQSLSLSSSNAYSLDTVIYKGPNGGTPSVRDWQRSKDSLQTDFGHHRDSYRSDSQGMFDNRPYPIQQIMKT